MHVLEKRVMRMFIISPNQFSRMVALLACTNEEN